MNSSHSQDVNKLYLEQAEIVSWPSTSVAPVRITMEAGVGLSIVILSLCLVLKPQGSHTVNQTECHSAHRRGMITEPISSVRQCKSCGKLSDLSGFASKGRDRPSALCKGCDNKRRRSSYSPKIMPHDWDHIMVNIELLQGDQGQLAPLVWEVLADQKIVDEVATTFKEETLDSLLNRRSAIDGIIERGST